MINADININVQVFECNYVFQGAQGLRVCMFVYKTSCYSIITLKQRAYKLNISCNRKNLTKVFKKNKQNKTKQKKTKQKQTNKKKYFKVN